MKADVRTLKYFTMFIFLHYITSNVLHAKMWNYINRIL